VLIEDGRWRAVSISTGGYEIDQITALGLGVTVSAQIAVA
jgi:hypothetical protein